MRDLEKIKNIMYDDVDGIFTRLRAGDYTISEEEKNEILKLGKEFNENLLNKNFDSDVIILAIDVLYGLTEYQEESWTNELADKLFDTMLKGNDIII